MADIRIVHREAFSLLGFGERRLPGSHGDSAAPMTLEEQWEKASARGFGKTLDQTRLGGGLFGAYVDCDTDGSYSYMVGCEVRRGTRGPSGLTVVDVPPMDYAVNRGLPVDPSHCCAEVGPLLINLHEWLKDSRYTQRCDSRLAFYEFYKNPENKMSVVEIWIPIIK